MEWESFSKKEIVEGGVSRSWQRDGGSERLGSAGLFYADCEVNVVRTSMRLAIHQADAAILRVQKLCAA
jgi:hypothetical protein